MELKPGYKQTEVGVIPDCWSVKTLIEIADHQKVLFDDGDWVEAEHLTGAGRTRLIQTGNIGVGCYVEKESKKYIYEESFEKLRCKELTVGDILICRLAEPAGRACIFPEIGEERVITSVDVTIFRPKVEKVDREFLVQYFSTRSWFESVLSNVGGTTHKRISRGALGKISVPFPPVQEQRAIATTLSDVDALLDSLDRFITKKRNLKRAAMQQLLTGKTRLPGFDGKWEVKRLGDIADIIMGQSPSSSNYNSKGEGFPLIQGNSDIIDRKTIKRIFTTQITKRGKENDILISVRAPVGEISRALFDVCLGRGVCALRFPNDYFYYYLIFLEPRWTNQSKGSTFDSVNSADVKAVEINMPFDAEEQTAIATVLSDMDAEIAALEQRRAKTRDIKQAMMQELLTGRIRLVKPDESDTQEASMQAKASPHNWAFNEAVVISMLAKHFGREDFPLGRKRYTKLAYLLHRYAEGKAEGYLKKAAGPYNPKTRYNGPEQIALQKGYIRNHQHGQYKGFIAAENFDEAETYFYKWYGKEAIEWLKQFRFMSNDDLELLATVDMAAEELRAASKIVNLTSIKALIYNHSEWRAKLKRNIFSDSNIVKGIKQCDILFNPGS